MNKPILTFIFLALTQSVTAAGRVEPIESVPGKQPSHLVPISPILGDYDKLLQRRLLVVEGDYGTFVFRPSFSGEMAVAVYGTGYTKDSPQEPLLYHITVTRAAKSLWYSMSSHTVEHRSKHVQVTRSDAIIDRELAVSIQRAWASMLLRTRYSDKDSMGLDGFTAQFSVFVRGKGQIYGETWSPDCGLPKEFVEIAFALADFALKPPKDRPPIRPKLIKRLQSFERKARNA